MISNLISRAILLLLFSTLLASGYKLVDTVIGHDFLNFFEWQTMGDPTHGRVQYLDQSTSQKLNLTYASGNSFILRADYQEALKASGPGRKSFRIRSNKAYTQHVAVFNILHMPQGCSTWPAIWEVSPFNWPSGGEIDIIEGANDRAPNVATLHTSEGCTMPNSRQQRGTSLSSNCYSTSKHDQGCAVKFPSRNSYGPTFNQGGGGWYALERAPSYVKIWFWSRNDPSTPSEVKTGASVVNPGTWGEPSAFFPSTSCNFPAHLEAHNIIINLDFCGDMATATYSGSGCPSNCVDFVNKNPSAFKNAYFSIPSLRIYQ